MLYGPAGSSLANTSAALRLPRAVGPNTTLTVQLPPAGTATPRHELEAMTKSEGFAPSPVTAEICKGALPTLVTVSVCGALCRPTLTDPKLRLAGLNWGRPTRAVPLI